MYEVNADRDKINVHLPPQIRVIGNTSPHNSTHFRILSQLLLELLRSLAARITVLLGRTNTCYQRMHCLPPLK